jgi:HAE1 family hydrophobic/amphiphilic exporter-1
MQIATTCIRRPVMTTLVMLSFVAAGFFGYRQLPVAALPQVDFPTISVSAKLPGASPETMASSVASVLERQFATIAGIDSITSTSTQGSSSIVLQFDLGRNIDGAALDVQSALSIAQRRLPDEMTTPPSFRKVNPADSPILYLALSSDSVPLSTVDEYAETLIAQQISMLSGVAQVQVYGAQKYAVRVQADLHALAARGLTLSDLQTAIANANSNSPVGNLDGPSRNYTIQATGPMRKAVDFMPVVVTYAGGNPVRIEDVATVIDSVENSKVASWFQGKRAIILAVQRQPDANTVAVVDRIRAALPVLRAGVPPSVAVDVLNDKSVSIRDSVHDVEVTLMISIALVILVIFIFLRNVTATIIPALALPVSLIGTFGGMYLFGFSIDNLSLLAITLSVGFVVDDAIVMLENIVRHVEAGMRPFEAALKGAQEIGFTIVSMTISLCAVFIPVLFMGGVVGRVFHEFGVTISMTILISGIVSLTLTPMLCSRLLRPIRRGETHGRFFRASEAVFEAAHRGYGWTLRRVVARPGIWVVVTLLTIAGTLYLYRIIPKGFFPEEDTGLIFATTEGPQDISFEAMVARQKIVGDIVQRDPYVDYVMSTVGAGGLSNTTNSGRLFIALKPRDERNLSSSQVIQRLRGEVGQVPGINAFFRNVQNLNIGGRPSKSEYQFTIQGPDFAEVERFAPILESRISKIRGAQDVTSDLQMQARHLVVDINRERASELGIDVEQVRSLLYSAFGTRQVSTIYTSSNDYEVILEAAPRFQSSPAALDQLHVRTASGSTVSLDTIAQYRQVAGPLAVSHQGQMPAVTISFNLAPGVALGTVVDAIDQAEREISLPTDVVTGFQGAAQVFQESLKGQGLLLMAAVLVIYVVLGILYESFIHPITILSGLPSAGIGALLTLMLTGNDLSVIAMIGIVMLVGIVKKNSIMMIDFALERRRVGGLPPAQAIVEACMIRFRPIMMTTMAAIFGTLPIAIGVGAGSELRRPLGLAVVGGLLLSQLLTLYITPVVYVCLDRLGDRLMHRRATLPAVGERTPAE